MNGVKYHSGLGDSSRIYHNPGDQLCSVDGTGTGALAPILKQNRKCIIKSIRFNDNDGTGGSYSLYVMRRGYNPGAGGPTKTSTTVSALIPAVTDTTNDFATVTPDLTVGGNQPGTANARAFQVPVAANEFILEQGDSLIVLNPFDELWVNASAKLNYEIVYAVV